MVRPPRLGKHQGARVASTSRAGSQTPSESPIRGMGEPQRQIGEDGLGVSSTPETLPIVIGPIEIGNRHSQHTSEIGLTKRPVQDCAEAGADHSSAASASAPSGSRRRIIPAIPARRRPPRHPACFPARGDRRGC